MLFNTSPLFVPHQAVHATVDQSLEEPLPLLSRNKRGVAFGEKTWPQHAVLNIALLNMTNDQKDLVKHNINQWAPYTNLYFKFTDGPHGDLRITADNNASSGWSKVGTDAKYVPLAKPTMSIGFNGSPTEVAAQIQHEFGHGLGLKHEHQHPDRTLQLDKNNIYEEFELRGRFPWEADIAIIQTLPRDQVTTSPYDVKSIMHYGFPVSRLSNGQPIERNTNLSEGDKRFMQALYPADNSPLGKLLDTAIRAMVNTQTT